MDAIYARQSIDKADSLSIEGQIDLCRRQADAQAKVYQDKGYSGKNTNRPAFRQLMEDVEKGLIRKIVVYRLDRFSRSISDFGRIWDMLKEHNVEFVSINETFDTSTPMGRAMLNIIMVFAQLERETTAERVRDNYYQRAKLGSWPGGPAPYGFTIGKLPGGDGKPVPTLAPNEQMAIVKRIFDAYAEPEASLGSVARALNSDGIPAPRREVWDNVALSRVLHSPLYVKAGEDIYLYFQAKGARFAHPPEAFTGQQAGMVVGKRDRGAGKYQDVKEQLFSLANHRGIIESDLWLKCQYKLENNRQVGRSGAGKHTWLSGLLKCAACGYSIKVNRDGEKYYLICSGRANLSRCHAKIRVKLRELETSVEMEMEKMLTECPLTEETIPADYEATEAILKIDQKIEHLMGALAEGSGMTIQHINQMVEKLEAERQDILKKQERHRTRSKVSFVPSDFKKLAFEEKKMVAALFIKEIRLSGEDAEVIWRV